MFRIAPAGAELVKALGALDNTPMTATADTAWGSLFDRPERVVICTGAARSGKSTAASELYRRCQDALGRPGCLAILPNAPAVGAFRDQLLALSPSGVLLAPATGRWMAEAINGRPPSGFERFSPDRF